MKFRTLTLAGILTAALALTAQAQNPQMQGAPGGAPGASGAAPQP